MSTSGFDFTTQIVSVKDIARNYKKLFDQVQRDKKPLLVFKRSKPIVAIIDMESYNKIERKKRREWEMKDAMKAIAGFKKAQKEGKLLTFNVKSF